MNGKKDEDDGEEQRRRALWRARDDVFGASAMRRVSLGEVL